MNLFVLVLLFIAASVWFLGRHLIRGRRLQPKMTSWINENPNILIGGLLVAIVVLLCLAILGIAGAIYGSGYLSV